jgi:glycosyltransferase involved in cell wall biosynthesis
MPNSKVRVSYLITTRNRGSFLARTLDNIREFITGDDELVIIDGKSSDNTCDVIRQNSDLVSTFISEPDASEGHAFNKGLGLVRGQFIKPITDDDYVYPEPMKQLIAHMVTNPQVDAIQCGGEVWEAAGESSQFICFKRLGTSIPSKMEIFSIHHGLGLIFRRELISRLGGVSPGYVSVDGDLVCKMIEAGCNLGYLDVNLYRWFNHTHSGVKNINPITRNYLMCLMRLNQWDTVFCSEPDLLGEVLEINKIKYAKELLNGIFCLDRIRRSNMSRVLQPLPYFVMSGRRLAAMLRGSNENSPHGKYSPEPRYSMNKVFSGKLLMPTVYS